MSVLIFLYFYFFFARCPFDFLTNKDQKQDNFRWHFLRGPFYMVFSSLVSIVFYIFFVHGFIVRPQFNFFFDIFFLRLHSHWIQYWAKRLWMWGGREKKCFYSKYQKRKKKKSLNVEINVCALNSLGFIDGVLILNIENNEAFGVSLNKMGIHSRCISGGKWWT